MSVPSQPAFGRAARSPAIPAHPHPPQLAPAATAPALQPNRTAPSTRYADAAAVPITLVLAIVLAATNSQYAANAGSRLSGLLVPKAPAPACFATGATQAHWNGGAPPAKLTRNAAVRLAPQTETLRSSAEEAAIACRDGRCAGNSLDLYRSAISSYLSERLLATAELTRRFGASGLAAAKVHFGSAADRSIEDSIVAMDAAGKLGLETRGPLLDAVAILAERGPEALAPCPLATGTAKAPIQ